jgi:RNA polymerase sigma-70 factor (ECF subfamily)
MSAVENSPSAIRSAMPPPARRLEENAQVAAHGAQAARRGEIGASPQLAAPLADAEQDLLTALIAAHQVAVRRLVLQLLGWNDEGVEDVVQEVFLSAWRHRSNLVKVTHVEAWLKRVAVNKCRSRLRRQAIRRRWLLWMQTEAEPQAVDCDQLAQQETAERVRLAITTLDISYREAIVLHYLENHSVAEIAELTGVRRNTVEVRLHRARTQLGKALTDLL